MSTPGYLPPSIMALIRQASPTHSPVNVTTVLLIHMNIAKKIAIFEILANFDAIFRGEGVEIAKK